MESTQKVLQQFDEIVRCYSVVVDGVNLEECFLRVLMCQHESISKYAEATDECKRLKVTLDNSDKDISVLENKLSSARRWLDAERQLRKQVESERDALVFHLDEVRRILWSDPRYTFSEDAKEKLSFLNKVSGDVWSTWRHCAGDRLNTITEAESISDISFSRSGDDLDEVIFSRSGQKHRSNFANDESAVAKRRKSSGTELVPSVIPDIVVRSPVRVKTPENDIEAVNSAIDRINSRAHTFVTKLFIMPESCSWCSKKIGFGKGVYKCLHCQMIAHPECYEKIPLPCIPVGTSPKKTGAGALISDYAPASSPMIPAIVIHCINEVERRGMGELGIYRMSGTESVVRGLRDKFWKGKGIPCLSEVDIHSVCCFLKDFLRNLQDPLVPRSKWNAFANAISSGKKEEKLHNVIVSLPQANRDSLAYLILHLQNVASSPECRMPVSSLATVFGPTIVGYSNSDPMSALSDTHTANAIMEELLVLPTSYWNSFINPATESARTPRPPRTPDVNGMHRKTPHNMMPTPGSRRKFFNQSPPLQ